MSFERLDLEAPPKHGHGFAQRIEIRPTIWHYWGRRLTPMVPNRKAPPDGKSVRGFYTGQWVREELNLRPHAYQAKTERQPSSATADSRRLSPARRPCASACVSPFCHCFWHCSPHREQSFRVTSSALGGSTTSTCGSPSSSAASGLRLHERVGPRPIGEIE
jgi:hypothetical protein